MCTKPKMSTDIQWHDEYEVYRILFHAYDVNKARRILESSPREIIDLDILGIPLGCHTFREDVCVDLTVPLILISFDNTNWPIDGWHRIRQALEEGMDSLPCVILNEEETKQVKL